MTPADDETIALKRAADGGTIAFAHVPRELGPVRLIREIGRGGMGEVWLGRHALLARDVAVKFLLRAVQGQDDPHFEQFLQEARTAAAVRHPHLVIVHDANVTGQVPYLVLEYIDGPTLAEVLRRRGALGIPETLAVLEAVAEGVGELHERGIVHRDIKPSNVLLDRDGRIVVSDFGLACVAASRSEGSALKVVAGTPAYMAPEMFDGESSPRSDVYALGIMAFQLLVGELPFPGSFEDVRSKHMNEALPLERLPGRDVDGALADVLERAAHKHATYRFKSAGYLLRALKAAMPDTRVWSLGATDLVTETTRHQPTAMPNSASEAKTPSSASYYQHLANIAATKRQRESGDRPLESVAHTPIPANAQQPARILAIEIPCAHCAYNLRGLDAAGACPECGTAIEASLRPDRLLFADKRWLGRVRFGLIISGVAPLPAFLLSGLVSVLSREWRYSHPSRAEGLFWLCILIALAVFAAGPLLVTTPEPRPGSERTAPRSRRLTRAAALLALSLVLMTMLGSGTFPDLPIWTSTGMQSIRLGLAIAIAIVGMASFLLYLRSLGTRIPDRRVARHGTEAIVVLAVTLSLIGIASLGGMLAQYPRLRDWAVYLAMLSLGLTIPWISMKLFVIARVVKRQMSRNIACAELFDPVPVFALPSTGGADKAFTPNDRESTEENLASPIHAAALIARASEQGCERRGRVDILTLKNCPQCAYSLKGLSPQHRCPECGFEYDESMFVLYGWMRANNQPGFWRIAGAFSPAVSVLLFCFVLMPVFNNTPYSWRWQDGVVLAVSVIPGLGMWLWRRRQRQQHGGAIQLAFSSAGASKRRGPGPGEFIPWSEFRRLRFRRVGRDVWRIRLTRGRWHTATHGASPYTLTGRPWIEGVIECSRRQAAALRGEIRRRMAAARR